MRKKKEKKFDEYDDTSYDLYSETKDHAVEEDVDYSEVRDNWEY